MSVTPFRKIARGIVVAVMVASAIWLMHNIVASVWHAPTSPSCGGQTMSDFDTCQVNGVDKTYAEMLADDRAKFFGEMWLVSVVSGALVGAVVIFWGIAVKDKFRRTRAAKRTGSDFPD